MNFQPGDTLVIQDTIVEANQLPLLSVPSTETLYAQSLEILPVMRMIDLKRKAARKEYAMAGGTFSPSVYARFTVGSNFTIQFFCQTVAGQYRKICRHRYFVSFAERIGTSDSSTEAETKPVSLEE